jgi:hypothetical protein
MIRRLAAALLLTNAGVHLVLFPEHTNLEHVEEGHAYIGWLFLVGAVVLFLATIEVAADHPVGWYVGALTSTVMLALLLASRYTELLPNGYHEAWEPLAVLTLGLELTFLGLYAYWLVARAQPAVHEFAGRR